MDKAADEMLGSMILHSGISFLFVEFSDDFDPFRNRTGQIMTYLSVNSLNVNDRYALTISCYELSGIGSLSAAFGKECGTVELREIQFLLFIIGRRDDCRFKLGHHSVSFVQ